MADAPRLLIVFHSRTGGTATMTDAVVSGANDDAIEGVEVRVHDSNADLRYVVLPMRPPGTEAASEAELAALVSRDCLVGTALPGRNPV